MWGTARVLDFLARQRDLYKYLHDQTARLMNHGLKAVEIAERLALPQSQARTWHEARTSGRHVEFRHEQFSGMGAGD